MYVQHIAHSSVIGKCHRPDGYARDDCVLIEKIFSFMEEILRKGQWGREHVDVPGVITVDS